MELFWESIGILEIILLYLVEKIVNIESGINMEDNYIAHQHMIMLSQVLNGLQMEIILP